ncbi:hypothetical protein [Coxiella burnetii]|uniref:hypothetical protein n=1 Tax=Coxiella burnetii TaxID=777 RepID=UPI000163A3DB|nr:hypothetical protein [Coxiella burnetii]AIT63200.1 putative membrane spanning protein [Coxiella burnetii str. Namibia]ATN85789.1 hypothetical protein AYO29_04600 [Coxiella burnetii str. Schperling]EDR36011.1 hypothetical protein COXBURSA334_1078 [Coxiella burnetii Q321]PHH58081.1 hypothetical protein CRH12_01025 [Coxiella burnetii]UYK70511.1 hypothetical protein OHM78_04585 [Coxiella burnetii]
MRNDPSQALLPRAPVANKFFKFVIIQYSALTYNAAVLATYWISADRFPEHMKWLENSISQEKGSLKLVPVGVFIGMESILFLTNQRTMPKRIEALLRQEESCIFSCYPLPERYKTIEAGISAFWKAAVSSTSLWALFTDLISLTTLNRSWSIGLGGALTFSLLPANFMAQIANFLKNYLQDWRLPAWFAWYCGIGYGLCNAPLYFNTFNKVLGPWVGGNLTELDNLFKKILFSLNTLISFKFAYSTSKIYSKRIQKMITPLIEESTPSHPHLTFSGTIDAVWKTVVTLLSVIRIVNDYHSLTTWEFVVLIFTLAPGVLPQLTFYANEEEAQRPNLWSSFCSFFSCSQDTELSAVVSDEAPTPFEQGGSLTI